MPSRDALSVAPQTRRGWFWCAAGLAIAALMLNLTPLYPHDFWWHLRAGQLTLQNGRPPEVDTFSLTESGKPFFYQPWLADVISYGLFRLGGEKLCIVAHNAAVLAALALVLRRCRARAGHDAIAAVSFFAGAVVGASNWKPRPQVFSILLFVAFLLLLDGHRARGGWRVWLLVPLMALWANVHGAFALGFAIAGAYLIDALLTPAGWRRAATLAALLAALAAAACINPHGPGIWRYVGGVTTSPAVRQLIIEWAPPRLTDRSGILLLVVLGGVLAARLLSHRKFVTAEILLLALFTQQAFTASRHTVWLGLLAGPMLAEQLGGISVLRRLGISRRHWAFDAALAGALGLAVVLSLPWLRPGVPLLRDVPVLERSTPVGAVDHLRELGEPRRLYHDEACGSYLIWAWPDQRVLIDTRVELYPEQMWLDCIAIGEGRDYRELLDRYNLSWLLLDRIKHAGLIEKLPADDSVQKVYDDGEQLIFAPRSAATRR